MIGPPKIESPTSTRATSICLCDCGNIVLVANRMLRNGRSKSCGCFQKDTLIARNLKHGFSRRGRKHPLYEMWFAMLSRCRRKSHSDYYLYGGRGIQVCERWKKFENFVSDVGERPVGKTLHRIDGDSNYEPSNCVWADAKTQARNTRRNKFISVFGHMATVAEHCETFSISQRVVHQRLKRGWEPQLAVVTPVRKLTLHADL